MLQLGFFLLYVWGSGCAARQVVRLSRGVCVEPFPESFDVGEGIFHVEVPDLCAPEGSEVGARLQGLSDVAGEGTDVGSLRAPYTELQGHCRGIEIAEFEFVDGDAFGFQFHILSLACQVVGAFSVDLAGGEGGWHLVYIAAEAFEDVGDECGVDVCGGEGLVHLVLQVKARCGGSELQGGDVFLLALLQLLDAFGGLSCADDHDAGSQGVESACMPHLQFLFADGPAEHPPHLSHQLEGGPVQGFVEDEYLSGFEIGIHFFAMIHLQSTE